MTAADMRMIQRYGAMDQELVRWVLRLKALQEGATVTRNRLKRVRKRKDLIRGPRVESGVVKSEMSTGLVTTLEEEENLDDAGGVPTASVDLGTSNYEETGSAPITKIDNFVERSVRIVDLNLPYRPTEFDADYKIYDLVSSDPAVRSKFRNFAFFKGDLVVRITVSGQPFHYGRLLFSWQKFPTRNATLQKLLSLPAAYRPCLLNYLSQATGAVTLDVRANEPLEMRVPYVFNRPMMRCFNFQSTAIGAATPLDDFEDIGSLYVRSINAIDYTTDAAPPAVSMTIYAYFDNVELGVNTATEMVVSTESGTLDERETGPIERFATSASEIAHMISQVPIIGSWAKASAIPLNMAAQVASVFGWSKPTMNPEPTYVKNMPYRNGANTIGYDTSYRITLDPKQEITVDPCAVATQEDEMSLAFLTTREAYLTTFTWDSTTEAFDHIWRSGVTPNMVTHVINSLVTEDFLQPTPLAFAAQPFAYWRGDIHFRFEIVASQFHRGKLAFFYEPNVQQLDAISLDLKLNENYVRLIDIQETQNIAFCVKWNSEWAWKLCSSVDEYRTLYDGVGGDMSTAISEFVNGALLVAPFTQLQSPGNQDVYVNVYVKGVDMKFNFFNDKNMPPTRILATESGMTPAYGDVDSYVPGTVVSTEDITCLELNKSSATAEHISEDYFGETPTSFRALLKRFQTSHVFSIPSRGDANSDLVLFMPNYPEILKTYTVNDGYDNLYSYLRYAYLGVRGGFRHRLRYFVNGATSNLSNCRVALRNTETVSTYSVVQTTTPTRAVMDGTINFNPNNNAGIEFEVPFYNNLLFLFSCAENLVGTGADGVTFSTFQRRHVATMHFTSSYDAGTVQIDSATGEDFSFLGFLGAPPFVYVL